MTDLDDLHLDDPHLEEILRRGFASRAATVQSVDPVSHPAYAPPRRGRNLWLGAGAAALLVVTGIPIAEHLTADPPITPGVTSRPVHTPAAPTGRRVESYAVVQLAVPPDWGWGQTPVAVTSRDGVIDRTGFAGARALDIPSGGTVLDGTPFVGRPVTLIATRSGFDQRIHPPADTVWFGSPLPVGRISYADGQVSSTQSITSPAGDPQHVTVFTRDERLRSQITLSVAAVRVDANGGATTQELGTPAGGVVVNPESLSLCAYQPPADPQEPPRLLWSARLGSQRAASHERAVEAWIAKPLALAAPGRTDNRPRYPVQDGPPTDLFVIGLHDAAVVFAGIWPTCPGPVPASRRPERPAGSPRRSSRRSTLLR